MITKFTEPMYDGDDFECTTYATLNDAMETPPQTPHDTIVSGLSTLARAHEERAAWVLIMPRVTSR